MRQTITGYGQDTRQGVKVDEIDAELLKVRKESKEKVEEIKKIEEGENIWRKELN